MTLINWKNEPFKCALKYIPIFEEHFDDGKDINSLGKKGYSILLASILADYDSIIESLIDAGAEVNVASNNGDTCVMAATINQNLPILNLLIKHSADLNKPNIDGATALHIAAEIGCCKALKVLLENEARANVITKDGRTPFDMALNHHLTTGCREPCDILLEYQARYIEAKSKKGQLSMGDGGRLIILDDNGNEELHHQVFMMKK